MREKPTDDGVFPKWSSMQAMPLQFSDCEWQGCEEKATHLVVADENATGLRYTWLLCEKHADQMLEEEGDDR